MEGSRERVRRGDEDGSGSGQVARQSRLLQCRHVVLSKELLLLLLLVNQLQVGLLVWVTLMTARQYMRGHSGIRMGHEQTTRLGHHQRWLGQLRGGSDGRRGARGGQRRKGCRRGLALFLTVHRHSLSDALRASRGRPGERGGRRGEMHCGRRAGQLELFTLAVIEAQLGT